MSEVSKIFLSDKRALAQVDDLLAHEGIRRDKNLDYICGIYDEDYNLIATGSSYKNTLRCFAVDNKHQGEGLLNTVISHLIEKQHEKNNFSFFLYTKTKSAKFFRDLGFYPIATVENEVVFMENQRTGFQSYLNSLAKESPELAFSKKVAAIVMNLNPFTLGHQYLIEKAASENDLVHVFIVSEDTSLVPFSIRKKLLLAGTAHLNNIVVHDSGSYIISSATFPSYFQKDEAAVSRGHALLDITVFKQIANKLGINRRYVGEEPFSVVTNIYNDIMLNELPKQGIDVVVVPRKEFCGEAISASKVRSYIKDSNFEALKNLVPQTTLEFFLSPESKSVRELIARAENVIHH